MADLTGIKNSEGILAAFATALVGAWAMVRRRDSLKPLKLAVAEIRSEQGEQAQKLAEIQVAGITRDEFTKAFDKIFEKLDKHRDHYDDQFRDLSKRVDGIMDRRAS